MAAALAAAKRAGRISEAGFRESRRELVVLWRRMDVIEAGRAVTESASDLADAHALRGYDAVHLASALQRREADPLYMLTWDDDLASATAAAGIDVIRNSGA